MRVIAIAFQFVIVFLALIAQEHFINEAAETVASIAPGKCRSLEAFL
jgi:hypothetical protein